MSRTLKIFWQSPDLPAAPADLAAALSDGRAVLCKDRPKITAGCFDGCFIKRYNLPGWPAKFKRCFRRGRPERARRAAEHLRLAGAATPPVLAVFREAGFAGRDYLVTAELPETAATLDRFFADLPAAEAEKKLLSGAAALLVKLHRCGFFHGDVNLRNLYFRRDTGEYGVIDLDSARVFAGAVPVGRQVQELARLGSSFTALNPKFTGPAAASALTAAYRQAGGAALSSTEVWQRMEYLLAGHRRRKCRREMPAAGSEK